jgi:hypothetical protein
MHVRGMEVLLKAHAVSVLVKAVFVVAKQLM